ncbi:MAG: hypothetical protein NT062_33320 [Proteobacteria bacterium]|nr:hypothetical protein [Pseudomonadota bacterium]
MPSRLSSLLVRDGLVGVKRMEKAFQRQVIYGGSLDTILLEMGLVPEERLIQYLALASGLPPAARDEGSVVDLASSALIPSEVAEQFRAVPVAIDRSGGAAGSDDEAVRVLVCSPLEISHLEDLADLIDRPLQPLITPEYRWHLAFATAYGLTPPARFTTLARTLDVDAPDPAIGRARSVIIEEAIVRPVLADDATLRMATITGEETDGRSKHVTLMGVKPSRTLTDTGLLMPARTPAEPTVAEPAPVEPAPAEPPTPPAEPAHVDDDAVVVEPPLDEVRQEPLRSSVPTPTRDAWGAPIVPPSTLIEVSVPTPLVKKRVVQQPVPLAVDVVGRDSPLPIGHARELLATATDRDTVFLTLLRATRARARWAGLLTVQGGAAIGRLALAEPGVDTDEVTSILIPLDAATPFRTSISTRQPHIGPLASGDPAIDAMLLRMGGTVPPSALIMPIVLRDRVFAVLVAHRGTQDIRIVDVMELLALANVAADAIGRLIVQHKAAGYRAPVPGAPTEFEGEVDTKRLAATTSDLGWAAPAASEPVAIPTPEVVLAPVVPIEAVLDEIEAAREGDVDDAIAEAVERSSEIIGPLMQRFPGKLRVDRFAVAGRPLRAAQYGGLLELVIALGSVASELLIEKMASPQRDVRFYATICAAELRPRNAVFALAERLFDQDFGVRATANEALSGYPIQDLGHALVRVRRAIHSLDPEVVAAATSALVELGDVEAIADLIAAVERGDRGGEHARRALVVLTAQDFGPSERKWKKWYEGSRRRQRIEWLIEGLSHKEDAIRAGAINDLRRLTGEYFGYAHDLPRKDRDAAAARWASWWREIGQRRFEVREDERQRPTALLPSRRE